jgi:hypothetical protein
MTGTSNTFADLGEVTVQFAHVAYRMEPRFELRNSTITGEHFWQTWDKAETAARIPDANVLVVSGFWDNSTRSWTLRQI